jgi:ATP-dependent Lon protease
MPNNKWLEELFESLNILENGENSEFNRMFSPSLKRIFQKRNKDKNKKGKGNSAKPEVLPILPLRGIVVYPHTSMPLTIGQPRSIRLIDSLSGGDRLIGMVTSKKPDLEAPDPEDLYEVGTIASIQRLFRLPDGTIRLLVQGIERMKIKEFVDEEPYLKAKVQLYPEELSEDSLNLEAMTRSVRGQFEKITEMASVIPQEIVSSILQVEEPLQVAYSIANFQRMGLDDAQKFLEINAIEDKLQNLTNFLTRELDVLEIGQKIQDDARTEIEKVQRDYFLREQMKAIQRELGEADDGIAEVQDLREKIKEAKMPEEANEQATRELKRLNKLPPSSAEYGVIRTYLDWFVTLPWSITTEDTLDIQNARNVLEEDHYGLKEVKQRLLEFLAVRKLRIDRQEEFEEKKSKDHIRKEREGVILCFVGPPGVGKTSLGQSIARALGRKFIRISLGGVRDEAEIRGHRRTYIGALPGRILQGLRRVESNNPVFMLDEIDKLGSDFRGDPASALLEVLDPEQNSEFRDHYLEVAYDLSQTMFITTANTLSTIPGPLRDRMEIIEISSYTERDKVEIAKGYLVPRQLRENGLREDEAAFSEDALKAIIRSYTREAGVRNLERMIGSICRKIVTKVAEDKLDKSELTPELVKEYLGKPRFFHTEEIATRTAIPGVATGLAWTPFGGDVLFVEATSMPGRNGFQLTGSLGEVMQESAKAALSYVRSNVKALKLDPKYFEARDIHLHVPAGAQPKDGPSAGVTMATAIVSMASNQKVKPDVGMTGEITLRGQVMPVGGVKEKVLAAHRAGLKKMILPARNEADLEEIPDEVINSMEFKFVETIQEVLDAALIKKRKKRVK